MGLARRRGLALVAIGLVVLILAGSPAAAAQKDCSATSTGLVPLTELGTATYEGEEGGLYPGGGNEIPPDHLQTGMELSSEVVPRLPDGAPDPGGHIVFISIGVSNTMAEFNAFKAAVVEDSEVNSTLILVNGAQVGRALGQWASANSDSTWKRVDENLAASAVTPEQVQVAWIMLPGRTRGPETLDAAEREIRLFVAMLQEAKRRYTNLGLAYLSSRTYGGYIPDSRSEPHAYNHGFEMKWVIEQQIRGSAELDPDSSDGSSLAPWISWGPYLWADGTVPREDGLVWECDDVVDDGVHPSESGQTKVAGLLMEHFKSDPTSIGWFTDDGVVAVLPETTTAVSSSTEPSVDTGASSTTGTSRSERSAGSATTLDNRNQPTSMSWWPLLMAAVVGAAVATGTMAVVLRRQGRSLRPQRKDGVDG